MPRNIWILGAAVAAVLWLMSRESSGDRLSDMTGLPDPDTYGGGNPLTDPTTTGTTPLGTSATREELRENARDLLNSDTLERMQELGGSRAGGGVV